MTPEDAGEVEGDGNRFALARAARGGEILVSETAQVGAKLDCTDLESRSLELKGKSAPTRTFVLRSEPRWRR
jgi:class 3 adenylate cyclase